jgi:pyruvate dehydrogenase E2 component (dihydrolipoamide acetyltransferase)
MGYIVRMPKLGLEMKEGTVLDWYFEEGESVGAGDVVAEIESEKSVGEVEAREGGVLRRIVLEEGATVAPGAAMGIVAGEDEDISDLESEIEPTETEGEGEAETADEPETAAEETTAAETAPTAEAGPEPTAPSEVKASPRAKDRASDLGVDLTRVEGTGPGGAITEEDVEAAAEGAAPTPASEVKASPRAEDRAADLGVDLTRVEGTGPGGAITEEDVEAAAAAAPAEEAGPATRTVKEAVEFGGMRRTIADRLSQSARNAVHVTEHRTVDAEAILEATEAAKEAMTTDVSMPDLLLEAISATLEEHPGFNATYEDETHTTYEEHNVGLAVDIEAGLIAPVLADVGGKSLDEIADTRREITERARSGDYTMDDLAGGTFTVTNLGVLGVEAFDPIINPPQVAILGVNAIEERAERTERGIEFRRKLPFSLSFDHRVVDGADAARFLQTLTEHVEDPWPLLPQSVRAAREGAPAEGRVATARSAEGPSGTVTADPYTWEWGDEAPSPVHMFLGSLAACLGYFTRVRWDEEDVDLGEITFTAGTPGDHGAVEPIEVVADLDTEAGTDTMRRIVDYAEQDCVIANAIREDVPVAVHLAGDEDADVSAFGRAATARTTDGASGTMTADSHTWEYGGNATPVHAFLGSLAACLTYFVRDHAMQTELDVGTVEVEARIPSEHGAIDSIDATVRLETGADDGAVATLVENAKRDCVVDDLIADDVPVDVEWRRIG